MRDLSRCSDPSLNPAFERHWRDTLQTARQFRCLARELPLRTVRRAARRTIIRWLEQGMETRGLVGGKRFYFKVQLDRFIND